MGIVIEETSTRKWVASSPLRGSSLKHPYATSNGGQDSLCVAIVAFSSMGPETLIKGEGGKDAVEMGAAGRMDSEAYHPSLEILEGED